MRTLDWRDLADARDKRNVATFAQAMKNTAVAAEVRRAPMRTIAPETSRHARVTQDGDQIPVLARRVDCGLRTVEREPRRNRPKVQKS